jgi:hypothetical protein
MLTLALVLGIFPQQLAAHALQVTNAAHAPVTLTSVLHLHEVSTEPAFSNLLTIGVDNHIPIGLVLAAEPNTSICKMPLALREGDTTVAELITAINSTLTGYQAELQDGVLDIIPVSPSTDTAILLDMRLSEFRSSPEPHSIMGTNLWMFIRAVIAPAEGSMGGGLSSTTVERVPGMNVTNQTVKSALNLIVDKGSGGVWILRSSTIKTLSSATPRPYDIYGYVGEEQLVRSIKCSE